MSMNLVSSFDSLIQHHLKSKIGSDQKPNYISLEKRLVYPKSKIILFKFSMKLFRDLDFIELKKIKIFFTNLKVFFSTLL